MNVRKSIVFIGSVLVLAACDRASSPTGPLSLHDGAAASARKAKDTAGAVTGTTTSSRTGECGFVKSGDGDSAYVCNDASIQ